MNVVGRWGIWLGGIVLALIVGGLIGGTAGFLIGLVIWLGSIIYGSEWSKRTDETRSARKVGQEVGTSVTGRRGPGGLDEIEKLAELRDKGLITAEEFEAKKAKILDI